MLDLIQILQKPSRTSSEDSLLVPLLSNIKTIKEKKLSHEEILLICKKLKYEFFEKDDYVFEFDDVGEKFYIILDGSVSI